MSFVFVYAFAFDYAFDYNYGRGCPPMSAAAVIRQRMSADVSG
jgi:hypothetical protein